MLRETNPSSSKCRNKLEALQCSCDTDTSKQVCFLKMEPFQPYLTGNASVLTVSEQLVRELIVSGLCVLSWNRVICQHCLKHWVVHQNLAPNTSHMFYYQKVIRTLGKLLEVTKKDGWLGVDCSYMKSLNQVSYLTKMLKNWLRSKNMYSCGGVLVCITTSCRTLRNNTGKLCSFEERSLQKGWFPTFKYKAAF